MCLIVIFTIEVGSWVLIKGGPGCLCHHWGLLWPVLHPMDQHGCARMDGFGVTCRGLSWGPGTPGNAARGHRDTRDTEERPERKEYLQPTKQRRPRRCLIVRQSTIGKVCSCCRHIWVNFYCCPSVWSVNLFLLDLYKKHLANKWFEIKSLKLL